MKPGLRRVPGTFPFQEAGVFAIALSLSDIRSSLTFDRMFCYPFKASSCTLALSKVEWGGRSCPFCAIGCLCGQQESSRKSKRDVDDAEEVWMKVVGSFLSKLMVVCCFLQVMVVFAGEGRSARLGVVVPLHLPLEKNQVLKQCHPFRLIEKVMKEAERRGKDTSFLKSITLLPLPRKGSLSREEVCLSEVDAKDPYLEQCLSEAGSLSQKYGVRLLWGVNGDLIDKASRLYRKSCQTENREECLRNQQAWKHLCTQTAENCSQMSQQAMGQSPEDSGRPVCGFHLFLPVSGGGGTFPQTHAATFSYLLHKASERAELGSSGEEDGGLSVSPAFNDQEKEKKIRKRRKKMQSCSSVVCNDVGVLKEGCTEIFPYMGMGHVCVIISPLPGEDLQNRIEEVERRVKGIRASGETSSVFSDLSPECCSDETGNFSLQPLRLEEGGHLSLGIFLDSSSGIPCPFLGIDGERKEYFLEQIKEILKYCFEKGRDCEIMGSDVELLTQYSLRCGKVIDPLYMLLTCFAGLLDEKALLW